MRLIDIDELWDAVADNWSGIGVCSVKDILEFIESMPTIYPEPVKHGRWKYDPDYGEYRCTFCNDWGAHEDERTHYCPNCGAKMEEERGGIYETD